MQELVQYWIVLNGNHGGKVRKELFSWLQSAIMPVDATQRTASTENLPWQCYIMYESFLDCSLGSKCACVGVI